MTDREKVIKGLGCCQDCDGYTCRNICPYYDRDELQNQSTCTCRLAHDALALINGQKARLVTYEDFHSGREDGGEAIPCWKEARSKTRRSGWAVIVYGKMLADRDTGVARYWTARPTEEQMREEAWPGA